MQSPIRPVSDNDRKPSDAELKETEKLLQFISETAPFVGEECSKTRRNVLIELQRLLKGWTKRIYARQGRKEIPGGTLYLSGSCRLGVNEEDSDVDVLCVVPKYISRAQFFGSFAHQLQNDSRVSNFNNVSKAFVPVISFDFSGVSIDLLLARLPCATIPNSITDIDSNSIFRGLSSNPKGDDFKTVLSLNGPRVTNILFKMAPNKKVFRQALKFMRHWAKQRGVYSNKTGYLGGVNLAIITCITCAQYPQATASKIILKVFEMLVNHNWDTPLELVERLQLADYNFQVYHHYSTSPDCIMPIITPAYPAMNSTYAVNQTTFDVMQEEFSRALHILQRIMRFECIRSSQQPSLSSSSKIIRSTRPNIIRNPSTLITPKAANNNNNNKRPVNSEEHLSALVTPIKPPLSIVTPLKSTSTTKKPSITTATKSKNLEKLASLLKEELNESGSSQSAAGTSIIGRTNNLSEDKRKNYDIKDNITNDFKTPSKIRMERTSNSTMSSASVTPITQSASASLINSTKLNLRIFNLERGPNTFTWAGLTRKLDFFGVFSHYYYITLRGEDEEELDVFKGFFHAKFRLFVNQLTTEFSNLMKYTRPYPKGIEDKNSNIPSTCFIIGFNIESGNLTSREKSLLEEKWNDFQMKTFLYHPSFEMSPSMESEGMVYKQEDLPLHLFNSSQRMKQATIDRFRLRMARQQEDTLRKSIEKRRRGGLALSGTPLLKRMKI